jgi:flagellum-specific peptidoglycan hydrolase FlgJ
MATQAELTWLQSMVKAAQISMMQWEVPASVTLAQCIEESSSAKKGWGQSDLALQCHNYFGVKAVQGQDYGKYMSPEYVKGVRVMELSAFAKYPSAEESFYAHAKLLATLPRYKPAMADVGDVVSFCAELQHTT